MEFAFIMNVEMTAREELIGMYSDTYKDAHGIRPRWINFDAMSDEEIEAGIDENCRIANENADADAKYADEQVNKFKAMIDRYINEFGAADETTALKWYIDSTDEKFYSPQCVEHLIWKEGFLFTDYGRKLVDKMCDLVKWED